MNNLNVKPSTIEQAYAHGLKSHTEGLNPFRNMGFETSELNNAWYDGFKARK